jgi:hypothetical protein
MVDTARFGFAKCGVFKINSNLKISAISLALIPAQGKICRVKKLVLHSMIQIANEDQNNGRMHSVPLARILAGFRGSSGTASHVKNILIQMQSEMVYWNSPTDHEIIVNEALPYFHKLEMKINNGEYWVEWSFPEKIHTKLYNPIPFARIDLEDLMKVSKSNAALSLFLICARYKASGYTPTKDWHWWNAVLRGCPIVENSNASFSDFNRDILKPATLTVKKETGIIFETKVTKNNKGMRQIQFYIFSFPKKKEPENLSFNKNESEIEFKDRRDNERSKAFNEALKIVISKLNERQYDIFCFEFSKYLYSGTNAANAKVFTEFKKGNLTTQPVFGYISRFATNNPTVLEEVLRKYA